MFHRCLSKEEVIALYLRIYPYFCELEEDKDLLRLLDESKEKRIREIETTLPPLSDEEKLNFLIENSCLISSKQKSVIIDMNMWCTTHERLTIKQKEFLDSIFSQALSKQKRDKQ